MSETKEFDLKPRLKISKVKKNRLKSLVKQHLFITPKYIENNNNFFFWKDLLQQYSYKKSVCVFVKNPDLTSKELHQQLLNCIHSILQTEIDRFKLYSQNVINIIEKDELLPFYIKKMVIENSKAQFDDNIKILEDYIKNDKTILTSEYIDTFYLTIKILLSDEFKINEYSIDQFNKDIYYIKLKNVLESKNNKLLKELFVNFIKKKGLKQEAFIENQSVYDPYINIYKNKLKLLTSNTFNCNFFNDKSIDVKIKRDVIECIERTLAMNIQNLPLSNRVKITQEIETIVPKIEIQTIVKLKEVNPLYFEIYQKSLRVSDKNSLLPKSVSNIINYLNDKYVKLIQQNKSIKQKSFINRKGTVEITYECKDKNKDICQILDKLKLISTFKFLMFFVNETHNLLKYDFFDDRKKIDNDIEIIKSLSFNLEYYSGGWSDNKKFETVEEYIYYLINNLNLYIEVLNIKLTKKETNKNKGFDQYLEKYGINKKWYNDNKEFVSFVNNRISFLIHYYSSKVWDYRKLEQEIRKIILDTYTDVDSDNLNALIHMFVEIIKNGENKEFKKNDYDYKKYGISKEIFDNNFNVMKKNYLNFKKSYHGPFGRSMFDSEYGNDSDLDEDVESDAEKFYDMFENTKESKNKGKYKEIENLADRLYIYIKNNPKFESTTLESFTKILYRVIKEIQRTEENQIETENPIDYLQYLKSLSKNDLFLLLSKDEDLLESITANNHRSYSEIPKNLFISVLFNKYKLKYKSENKEYKELKEGKELKESKREHKESKRGSKEREDIIEELSSFPNKKSLFQYLKSRERSELLTIIDYLNLEDKIDVNASDRYIIDAIINWWQRLKKI